MRYLLLNSWCLLLLLPACRSVYKNLQPAEGDIAILKKFQPAFERTLYTTQVDVVGNHLSGLLLVKSMPDSAIRMVFSNEMGFKFFDFEFMANGEFKVHYILDKMNKKAVITTLRKDFELLLMQDLDKARLTVFQQGQLWYYRFAQEKGYNYYITSQDGSELIRMERASKRKPVAVAVAKGYSGAVPDSINIMHKNFNFVIDLKRTDN